MPRPSRRTPTIFAIVGTFAVGASTAPAVCVAAPVRVDIPSGRAGDSLIQLGRETGLQIIYIPNNLATVRTPELKGEWEPREALRLLLAGTDLTFSEAGEGTVFVHRKRSDARRDPDSNAQSVSPPGPKAPASDPQIVLVLSKPCPHPLAPAKLPWTQTQQTVELPRVDPPMGQLHEMVVCGVPPNLLGIDPLVVDREEIHKSGLATTAQLVNTLPQNFGGGPNENTVRGNQAETNSSFGSGINLRGLSDDGTIVLVNGRRLAPSGTAGAFTDIANLPLAAIDHMEVIPEGTTALYGVDAIGGIVNFVTRQDVGLETHAEVGGLAQGAVYEERFGQSDGWRWDTGNAFVLLEYDERDALPASRRRLATSDLVPFGGQNFDTPYGNPGTIETFSSQGGYTTWAIPHGQNGVGLQAAQMSPNTQNLYNQYAGNTLLPRQQLTSLVLSGNQSLSSSATVFLDGLFSRRRVQSQAQGESVPVTVTNVNPYYVNPTGGTGPVTVFYDFGRDLGPVVTRNNIDSGQVTAGMTYEGGFLQHLEVYTSLAYERQHQVQSDLVSPSSLENYANDPYADSALNVFADGSYTNPATLAAIRSEGSLTLSSRLGSADLTTHRTLFHMPGGYTQLTLNEEFRRQDLQTRNDSPGNVLVSTDLSRTTLSSFAEILIPLIGADNRLPAIERLDLSLGTRYEHYSDVGPVTAPQLALTYSPWQRLLFRGTWARLAHAPDLPDLSEAGNASTLYPLPIPPPKNGQTPTDGYTTALIWTGNNSELKPETATTWSMGANLVPFESRNLSLGFTYFHTDFTNRISDPIPLPINVLLDPALSWLLPAVTPEERAKVCSHSLFIGIQDACLSTPISAIVDLRIKNVASLAVQGADVAALYEWDPGLSVWKFKLNATRLFHYLEQQTPSSSAEELLSTLHNPIDLRMRASLSWSRRDLWAATYLNYQHSYRNPDIPLNASIGAWSTVDAAVGYQLRLPHLSATASTEVSISAQNLFNHYPPFVNNAYGIGYDQENANLLGRVVSVRVRQVW